MAIIQVRLCQLPACWLAKVCLAQAPSCSELCSPSCEPCFWEDTHYTHSEHLHWLPVHLRAEYKLLSIVFSVLNTYTAPIYLRDLLKESNRRTPRSNTSAVKLDVAGTICKTGERTFAVCASSRWNLLPAELCQCDSLESFKRQLKTHFYNVFFNVNDVSNDTGC